MCSGKPNSALGRYSLSPLRVTTLASTLCVAGSLTACAPLIPKDGPSTVQFSASASAEVAPERPLDYVLIPLSARTVDIANHSGDDVDPIFSSYFKQSTPTQAPIAVGDILAITIFEATGGGMFLPAEGGSRQGNFVTVPNQQVDSSGFLTTPYAGSLKVVGKTPQRVAKEIAAQLSHRAIEPQVVVTMVDRRNFDVSVLGDVNLPQRFGLDPGGIRLMDALARAGGTKDPAYETVVNIQRRGQTESALLSKVVKSPQQNVELQAGDVVYVAHHPKIFVTLGATLPPGSVGGINNRRFPFDEETESLSQALAKSGGLDDSRANSKAVYVYRLESKRVAEEAGIDTRRFAGALVPTIYQVDLSRPDGFFLTNNFNMRDNDMIFVANAITTDLNKLLVTIGLVSTSTYNFTQANSQIKW